MSTLKVDTITSQDGTASPDFPNGLAVSGTLTMNDSGDALINRSVSNGSIILSGGSGSTGGATAGGFIARGSSSSYNPSGIEIYTNGTEALKIDSSGNVTLSGSINISNISTGNITYTGTLTGGTDIVNLGSGQFYKDASGNVGIGGTFASEKLEVYGNIRTRGASTEDQFIEIGHARTGNGYSFLDLVGDITYTDYGLRIIRNNGGANTTSTIQHRGTGDLQLKTDDSADITFSTNATERARIDSSGLLGLGTNVFTDSYKTIIEGSDQETGNLTDSGAHGATLFLRATGEGVGSGGAVAFGTTFGNKRPFAAIKGFITDGTANSTGDLVFSTRATTSATELSERLRITDAGNVGIGTTSPASTLDVTGTVTADGLSVNGDLAFTGTSRTISAVANLDVDIDSDSSSAAAAFTVTANGGSNNVFKAVEAGDISFYEDTGTTAKFFWDASTERLGINTINPSATLDVEGEFTVTGGGSGTILVNDEDSSLCPTMTFTRNGVGTTTNDFIKFENSGGEVAAINSAGGGYFSGNVRIGTTTPNASYKLDVAGSALIQSNLRVEGTQIRVVGASSAASPSIQPGNDGDTGIFHPATNNIGFSTTGVERMRIDSSGNVGIGTTSPDTPLDIARGSGGDHLKLTNTQAEAAGTTNYNVSFQAAYAEKNFTIYNSETYRGLSWIGFDSFGDEITFGTSPSGVGGGTERMRIDSSGNLIANGTNARGKVTSNLNFGNSFASNFSAVPLGTAQGQTAGYSFYSTFEGTADNGPRRTADIYAGFNGGSWGTQYLSFCVGKGSGSANDAADLNTERMRIDGSGNVGIGLTGMDARLHVYESTSLGTSLNNTQRTTIFQSQNGNTSAMEILQIRDSAGTDWTTAGNRIQQRTDATWQSYIQFNGTGNQHGLSIGAGTGGSASSVPERFRLNQTGDFFFNCSTQPAGGVQGIRIKGTDTSQIKMGQSTGLGYYFQFYGLSAEVGSIYTSSGTTTYATTSDYRLKENISQLSDGIDRLKRLSPVRFNFIGEQRTIDGFIAHEVQEVVPEAVVGDKDAVDEEGNPKYQALDASKIVPVLTSALQQALEKIEVLERKINALEERL